jgi:hypothetical protein
MILCVGLLPACSSDDDTAVAGPSPAASPSATADAATAPFVLFEDNAPEPGWRLSEAVQPAADAMEFYEEITPGMAWYGEWDGPGEDAYLSLNMIGHFLADLQDLSPLTDPQSGTLSGRPAQWGDNLNGGGSATTTVRVEWQPGWTVELRGTVPLDTLREWAERLQPATKKEWRAAGGQSGCRPFASRCDG